MAFGMFSQFEGHSQECDRWATDSINIHATLPLGTGVSNCLANPSMFLSVVFKSGGSNSKLNRTKSNRV